MKKKISLKDIAKKVGVSTATVSYVLSKDKESKVSAEVAKKVKEAAKELNYQPNQIAKSLKMGKTFTIGLIVADISNPFFAHISRIIEDEAAKLNYTVIFVSSDEKTDKSWKLIQFLINRQVDGFILAPTEDSQEQIKYLKDQDIPFVLIDRHFPDIQTNYVVIDNFQAAFEGTQRLIKTGNEKIGMIAYSTSLQHMADRIKGYKKALKDNEIKLKKEWIEEIDFVNTKAGVERAIDKMLLGRERVKAIFFATNTLAVFGLKYIDELNYKVPRDVSIVSFDEGEAFDFYYCPLTYVKQPLVALGQQAVKVLIKSISNSGDKEQQICLKAELITRKSCSRS